MTINDRTTETVQRPRILYESGGVSVVYGGYRIDRSGRLTDEMLPRAGNSHCIRCHFGTGPRAGGTASGPDLGPDGDRAAQTGWSGVSPVKVEALGEAFYTKLPSSFLEDMLHVLKSCEVLPAADRHVVVLFTAKPTPSAEEPLVVHVVLRQDDQNTVAVRGFPGIETATWVYLTDDPTDIVRTEFLSSATENPLIGSLGALAGTIIGAIPATVIITPAAVAPPPAKPKPGETIFVSIAPGVRLPFERGKIVERVFVGRTVTEGKDKKPVQYHCGNHLRERSILLAHPSCRRRDPCREAVRQQPGEGRG